MEITRGSLAMDYTINGNISYVPMRMILPYISWTFPAMFAEGVGLAEGVFLIKSSRPAGRWNSYAPSLAGLLISKLVAVFLFGSVWKMHFDRCLHSIRSTSSFPHDHNLGKHGKTWPISQIPCKKCQILSC